MNTADALSPVLCAKEPALIGEPGKYVTMADRRFTAVEYISGGARFTLEGAPGEKVTSIGAYDARADAMIPDVQATIGQDGTATATIGR